MGGGAGVVGAAPEHELLLAELLHRLLLVLALQVAVVALVEPPVAPHRDPVAVGGVEREVGRRDRAAQHRGVHDVGEQPRVGEHPPAGDGLAAAPVGEVHVDPAGEEVLGVPDALAVAEQDEVEVMRGSLVRAPGRPSGHLTAVRHLPRLDSFQIRGEGGDVSEEPRSSPC